MGPETETTTDRDIMNENFHILLIQQSLRSFISFCVCSTSVSAYIYVAVEVNAFIDRVYRVFFTYFLPFHYYPRYKNREISPGDDFVTCVYACPQSCVMTGEQIAFQNVYKNDYRYMIKVLQYAMRDVVNLVSQ